MSGALMSIGDASRKIEAGETLLVAGEEDLLDQLPTGNWIGGTTPYFMTEEAGLLDKHRLFVTALPPFCIVHAQQLYDSGGLPDFAKDGPANGFSLLLIPAFTTVHAQFAENASDWPGVFDRPVAGWIAGVALDDLDHKTPKVFDGATGRSSATDAVAMHVALPRGKHAEIDILNLFTQGDGDEILFPRTGFSAKTVQIGGQDRSLAEYMRQRAVDSRLPLVADYHGAMINVSIQQVDDNGTVHFYAPVFNGATYKFAAPVQDYAATFAEELSKRAIAPAVACNCVLNYLYAGLEGKRTGHIVGPMAFGEIAYVLVNQTLVYLTIVDD
jgi:hypothetical protein